MAVVTRSTIREARAGGTVIYKYANFDCVAGDETDVIDTAGYNYAVVYAKKVSGTGTGTGALQVYAYNSDADANMPIAGLDVSSDGDLDAISDVMLTADATLLGTAVNLPPAQTVFVHDGGNGGTLLIDLYVELHR